MTENALPGPLQRRAYAEHPVAEPERLAAFLEQVPKQPEILSALAGRHVLSVRDFSPRLLLQIGRVAGQLEAGTDPCRVPLAGKILCTAFIDDSNSRTRLSFETAWLRLGGNSINLGKVFQRFSNHTAAMVELAELCNSYGDIALLRTPPGSAFQAMLELLRVPVINAGDGIDENPTHAMADLYTILKWRPELMQSDIPPESRINVAISGWPAQSRTIRSFLLILGKFAHAVGRVVVFGRQERMFSPGQLEELQGMGLKVELERDFNAHLTMMESIRKIVPEMDVIYVDEGRYRNISHQGAMEALAALKPDALMFHPELRPDELAEHLDNSVHNGYFAQQRGAVFIRMALLACVMNEAR
jgi:aspartate carbamoyltransferase catalytic subunit